MLTDGLEICCVTLGRDSAWSLLRSSRTQASLELVKLYSALSLFMSARIELFKAVEF